MTTTPNDPPGDFLEDEITLRDLKETLGLEQTEPQAPGGMIYVSGRFVFKDSDGVLYLRPTGGDPSDGVAQSVSLTVGEHPALRQLIHFVDEGPAEGFFSGAHKVILPDGSTWPTSVVWWDSESKTVKIVEKLVERSAGGATNIKPTPITWIMYDDDGSQLAKVIDTIVYTGVFESTRTREIKILKYTQNDTVGVTETFTITVT